MAPCYRLTSERPTRGIWTKIRPTAKTSVDHAEGLRSINVRCKFYLNLALQ